MLYVTKREGDNPMGSFEQVLSENQFLVLWVINKMWRKLKNNKVDREEAIQVGNIAMWKAYEAFNPAKKVKFGTYAAAVIFRDINTLMKDSRPGIPLKNYVYHRIKKGTVNPDTLPKKTMSIDPSFRFSNLASKMCNTHADIDNQDSLERIGELIEHLPEREQTVFMDHLFNNVTYKDLAARYGCSQESIRNWFRNAVSYLKRHMGVLDVGDPVQQRRRSRKTDSADRRHGCQRVHGKNRTLAATNRSTT